MDSDLCSEFTVDEMQQALRTLKSGKAPGPDSIHPEFLMHLGTECQNWLRMFMTNCMQRTKIPKSWRRAKIIAILKPGKSPEEAGSYRPISLLSVCFKLLERLIYNRLLPVVDPQLPREQAGFRPGRSTVEQVVKLTEDIETAFENRKKCGAVFVDLSADYDTVWHRGLTLKMLQLIPTNIWSSLYVNLLQTEASNYTLAKTVQRHTPSRTACLKALSLHQCSSIYIYV